jgi:hypothetical protein
MMVYKFRANYTDGSRGVVRGMSTCEKSHVAAMAKSIARRENVQSVKVLSLPTTNR